MTTAPKSESGLLAASGIAALLASSCCLGPLLLVTLGFSGAWIGNLAALEPYRPWFLAATLALLAVASWRIFRAPQVCAPGTSCANPNTLRLQRILFVLISLLALAALVFPWFARFFY